MYTLLTGATGLVGRYLLRDLLLHGHKLAVVVRPSRRDSATTRIETILQMWESELATPLPRPVVLSGDISEPQFGLSDSDREWITRNVGSIIHSAAILEFHGEDREREPWRTNLGGTRNMIAICKECDIRDIHHVSTAYVAGARQDRVMEHELDVGQSFRNDYEHSKFLSESEVRAIDFADHVTVYRPAVISGDSRTGYTNTYHGIYLYLRLMATVIPQVPVGENGYRHTPMRLRMTGKEARNIIPVEWVSQVMVRLFETPEARDGTYHIAPDVPMTSGQMIRDCTEYFGSTGVEFCGPGPLPPLDSDAGADQLAFERLVTENMGMYEQYERSDNVFDLTQMKRFCSDLPCPPIDRTVLHRYIEYALEDRWGKRRQPVPVVSSDTMEFVEQLAHQVADTDTDVTEDASVFGLDVLGPGGLQWTITVRDGRVVSSQPGLPTRHPGAPVLSVESAAFAKALQRDEVALSRLADGWDVDHRMKAEALTDALFDAIAMQGQETARV